MKQHKLPTHGASTTKCGVRIPAHLAASPIAVVWSEPDGGDDVAPCARCYDPVPSATLPTKPIPPPVRTNDRLIAYAIHKSEERGLVWTKTGSAEVNRDGSINVWLDAMPLPGDQLHLRRVGEKPPGVKA